MQRMPDFIAIDLGGTRIKAGFIAAGGTQVAAPQTVPTPADGPAALARVCDLARAFDLPQKTFLAVGLAIPGLVRDHSTLLDLPGKLPGLVGRDLRAALEDATGHPAIVLNDALAYGLGEVTAGAGRGFERVVVMTIGTGIGVSVMERGAPLGDGPLGAGTLGGMIPIADGDPELLDSNGQAGTIEALCAARRLVDYANAAGGGFTSVPEVFAAHGRADPAARKGVERFRTCLARALVALAQAHAPSAIIVGGGPITFGGPILQGLEARVRTTLWKNHELTILPSALGDAAALLGLRHEFVRVRSAA